MKPSHNLLLLPEPRNLSLRTGRFQCAENVVLQTGREGLPVLSMLLQHCLPEDLAPRVELQPEDGQGFWFRLDHGVIPDLLPRPESYRLHIGSDGAGASAQSAAGLRWSALTFLQLLSAGNTLPCLDIEDWPAFPWRGIRVDLTSARMNDVRLLQMPGRLAGWKLNTILLRVFGPEGSAISLPGAGEPPPVPPLDEDVLSELLSTCDDLGMRVIPDLDFAGLAQQADAAEVLQHVAALFPDPVISIGGCEDLFDPSQTMPPVAGQAGPATELAALAASTGKRPLACLLPSAARGLDPRMHDHQAIAEYRDYTDDVAPGQFTTLAGQNFAMWGASLMMPDDWRLVPPQLAYRNISRMAMVARAEGAEGVSSASGPAPRSLPGVLGLAEAWAADQAWNPGQRSLEEVIDPYLRHHFGYAPSEADIAAQTKLIEASPEDMTHPFWNTPESLAWHDSPEGCRDGAIYESAARGLSLAMAPLSSEASRNVEDAHALELAGFMCEHLSDRRLIAAEVVSRIRQAVLDLEDELPEKAEEHLQGAARILRLMEQNRNALFLQMQELWDAMRLPEDPARNGVGGTESLYWWFGSRESYGFSLDLAASLEHQAAEPDEQALKEWLASSGIRLKSS